MRHHLLLAFFDRRLKGFWSLMDAAFSVALSLRDRRLRVRDNDSVSVADCGRRSESVSGFLGAEVGAGLRDLKVEAMESCDDNDRVDGESSARVDGIGEPLSIVPGRLTDEIRGLCIADGAAEGYGLACRLYAPSVPNETGVEKGRGCT